MFGIASRSLRSRTPRIFVQEPHAPHRTSRRPTSPGCNRLCSWCDDEVGDAPACRSVRTRVASSDWCASRNVVSVSSSRFCDRVHSRELLRAQFLPAIAACPRAAPPNRAAESAAYAMRAGGSCPPPSGFPLTITSRQIGQQLRRAVSPRREPEQRRRLFQPRGGNLARLKLGMIDHVLQERDIGLHAAHAELAQGRDPCAGRLAGNSRPHAVVFTSSES